MGKINNMGHYSEFISRKGIAKCSDEQFFRFITDIRNFDRFVGENLSEWQADASHCSFSVSPVGKVNAELTSSEPSSKAVFSGETALTGKVMLNVLIEPKDTMHSEVTLTFGVELSPFLRIIIGHSVENYLEKLMQAIEGYDGYESIR
jgi:hypothetical protein